MLPHQVHRCSKVRYMDNNTRFAIYVRALEQFSAREGHSRCPAIHIEIVDGHEVFVGAWVGYVRQRYKKGVLPAERIARLEMVSGWEWGPLKPGPATNQSRNTEILQMREQGQTLRQIADLFDLSRQRVHQIVKRTNA
jgi:DNA-binding NarL/FixJ family response regulator